MPDWLMARPYALYAAVAGALYGVLLGVMSAAGLLDFLDPVARGLAGIASAAVVGVLVAPWGSARSGEPLTRGRMMEAAIASALSCLVVWPVTYSAIILG